MSAGLKRTEGSGVVSARLQALMEPPAGVEPAAFRFVAGCSVL